MIREFLSTVNPIPFTIFALACTFIVLVFYWIGVLSYNLMIGYVAIVIILYVIGIVLICHYQCRRIEDSELIDDDEFSIEDLEEYYVYNSILYKKNEK